MFNLPYPTWGVTAGDQPPESKWDQLGINMDALSGGTAIQEGAIVGEHLSTAAILLGLVSATSVFTTTSTTFVDVLTKIVTVPDGGRKVKISFNADSWAVSATGIGIYIAVVRDGTRIATLTNTGAGAGFSMNPAYSFVDSPTPGSHTYKIQVKTDAGTVSINAGANFPMQMVVEAL